MLLGVRWYVAYPLSDRPVEALMEARGVPVDHAPRQRWVVPDRPCLAEALQRRQRSVWGSWRLDEPALQVHGQWSAL